MDKLEYMERELRRQLADMRMRHQQEMKPIIDQLIRIDAMRPRSLVISADQITALTEAHADRNQ